MRTNSEAVRYNGGMPHLAFSPIKVVDLEHLKLLVREHIDVHGYRVSLAHLDVSDVTSMENVFQNLTFQGDISNWDVSKVESFDMMFYGSTFKQDISKWNTSSPCANCRCRS